MTDLSGVVSDTGRHFELADAYLRQFNSSGNRIRLRGMAIVMGNKCWYHSRPPDAGMIRT